MVCSREMKNAVARPIADVSGVRCALVFVRDSEPSEKQTDLNLCTRNTFLDTNFKLNSLRIVLGVFDLQSTRTQTMCHQTVW